MTPELAFVAALLAGFFGSTHCIGMCGAVVVLFEGRASDATKSSAWVRRLTYNFGRLCFYALLGSVAGVSGAVLTKTLGVSQGLMLLRILAAALVIAIGLNLLFDWRLTRFLETAGTGLWSKLSQLAFSGEPCPAGLSTAQSQLRQPQEAWPAVLRSCSHSG